MRIAMKAVIFLAVSISLVVARPNPEAEPGYRSEDDDVALNPEARSQNSITPTEQESEPKLLPYGALKLAERHEPWGALKIAVELAEQERAASERLLTERESVEISATPEPDTEIVESLPSDDELRPCNPARTQGTTLYLRPYAKAVAGAGGTAIAAPVSRALTRHATDIIVFEPTVVAIVGPGGHAVASSRLIIDTIAEKSS